MGFGNAVVLQTMLKSHMAVGAGFGQFFRGIGQVGGVAISSAIFQSKLESALRERIHDPNAEEIIAHIRQNARAIATLEPELQRIARDSYAVSLKVVFAFASVSALFAYIVRLPIPDKILDSRPGLNSVAPPPHSALSPAPVANNPSEEQTEASPVSSSLRSAISNKHSLSTFESPDGVMDSESSRIGGSARTGSIDGS
ncbi:hypothetical protein BDP27DRAFT_1384898 [Rhodocollybia butyracea]|uniref:Uncharacterized protein n=1 Tax=Rhodocollybia butyracea TaxID=206335 RepID=A0A9P5U2K9_9AGAR|nr:hypothetical protein BDP27DRAFT_1384898 [Rhodocollybia butyracea]